MPLLKLNFILFQILFFSISFADSEKYLPDVLKPFGQIASFHGISIDIIRKKAEKEFAQNSIQKALHAFAYIYREKPTKNVQKRISQCFAKLNMNIFQLIWDWQNEELEPTIEEKLAIEYFIYTEHFFRGLSFDNHENPYIRAEKYFFSLEYQKLSEYLDKQKKDQYGIFLFQKNRLNIINGITNNVYEQIDYYFKPILENYLQIAGINTSSAKDNVTKVISSEQIFLSAFLNEQQIQSRFHSFSGQKPNPFWLYAFQKKKKFSDNFPLTQWKSFNQNQSYRFFSHIMLEYIKKNQEIFQNLFAYYQICYEPDNIVNMINIDEYHYLFELETAPVWNIYEKTTFSQIVEQLRQLMLNCNLDIHPLKLSWQQQKSLVSYELNPHRIVLNSNYFFMDEQTQLDTLYRATMLMLTAIDTLNEQINYQKFLRNYWLFNAISLQRTVFTQESIRIIEKQILFPLSKTSLQNFACNSNKDDEILAFDYQCKIKGAEILPTVSGKLKDFLQKFIN